MQIQFLTVSISFKRQNNYTHSAWLPTVMRLRNVIVGLTNNSLFLTVAPEEALGVSPIRTVPVTVLKGLARATQCPCFP